MRQALLLLVSLCFTQMLTVSAQCLERDSLTKRILALKNVIKPPAEVQLKELLGYAANMNGCGYKNDTTHVFLLGRIADIYFKQGNFLKSVAFRHEAIDIITANAGKPSVKVKVLPGRYYYLSVAYDSLGNFTEKMRALDSCAAIAMRLKHIDRASLTALYTRVEYFFDIGDYQRCIDYAEKCEMLAAEYAKTGGPEQAAGEYYVQSSLGWNVEALLKLKKLDQAEKLLIGKIDLYRQAKQLNYLGLVNGQLAQVMEGREDYHKALYYFNESLKYYRQDKDYFNCKQTLKDIGYRIFLKHYNDPDKALSHFQQALRYKNENDDFILADKFESLNIFASIGSIYERKDLYDSAFRYFQLAFDNIKPGVDESNILTLPPESLTQFKRNYYVTDLLLSKAQAYRNLFEKTRRKEMLVKAVTIYKITDRLLDRMKTEQTELESKLFWRSDSRRLYESALASCYLSANVTDALYFFEKGRAVLLNDQLNENRLVGEQDIMNLVQLRKKLNGLHSEADSLDKSAPRYKDIQLEQFAITQKLDRLQQDIRSKNPLYHQSFLDTGFITLRALQAKLSSNGASLLELFTGDSAVYSLLVNGNTCRLTKINKRDYDRLTDRYISYISDPALMNADYGGFVSVAHSLYQLIFKDGSPAGRLIVSPDGRYFPFESLVVSKPGVPVQWFLNDHAISYTYSARFFMNDFSFDKNSRGRNFIGLAPVSFQYALSSLVGSDESLKKISGVFDQAVTLSGADASRRNFLQQYSNYKVIQLYTHSSDTSSSGEPVIYFADSALYLSELIGEYRPVTRLIVLSACQTGLGKDYKGEGVFSFNRGFAALGIPAAVTNLWSVDNKATYMLTEFFYKWLAKGLPTDIALQRAKLEYLQVSGKERSLPFYWAAPVLVGKADVVDVGRPSSWKWILMGVVGIALLFWIWKERTAKKKEATQS